MVSHVDISMRLRKKIIENLFLSRPKNHRRAKYICAIIPRISCKINYHICDICLIKDLGNTKLLTVQLCSLSHPSLSFKEKEPNVDNVFISD